MISENLNNVWEELESETSRNIGGMGLRLVCRDLLYRTYLGVVSVPRRRLLLLEVPAKDATKYQNFSSTEGFEISIKETGYEKEGFVSCIMMTSSSELNDVFSILAEDILVTLQCCNAEDEFVSALESRLDKWKEFFRKKIRRLLSEDQQIGLLGELWLVKSLLESSLDFAIDMWNGPVRTAQDFQYMDTAIEVKATLANHIGTVVINSADQLSNKTFPNIYLGVVRLSRSDISGKSLPEFIQEIEDLLVGGPLNKFRAKLLCLGYDPALKDQYEQKFKFDEILFFSVGEGFPRITRECLPRGVEKIRYDLNLSFCKDFEVNFETVLGQLKGGSNE